MFQELKARIQLKHETEQVWENTTNFIPMIGEIIVYDVDDNYNYERFKIGDGVKDVNALPFSNKQADWNQNDETADDYIKNRTHYTEQAAPILETSVTFDENGEYSYGTAIPLTIGKTYIVKWNGVEYKCVAQDASSVVDGAIGLGNGTAFGLPSNNEPFVVASMPSNSITGIMSLDGSTEARVSVTDSEIIHKLDNKYLDLAWLPCMVKTAGETLFDETVHLSSSGSMNREEVPFTITPGKTYFVTWDGVEYECVAKHTEWVINAEDRLPVDYIGNLSFTTINEENSGEPFVLYTVDNILFNIDNETIKGADVTVKVAEVGLKPNKMPEEYLPDNAITEEKLSEKGYLTSYTETDPTVPSWAKASTKPTYTKSEVGLGNVDNVKQYSASNPPPYPVTSVNGKTGAVTVSAVPSCTTSNNGQFLRVVNGVATWSTVPNAEGGEFLMAEYLIQEETLTGIADKIRILSGTEDAMTTAQMDSSLGDANNNIATEADLIAQITSALEGKAGGGGSSGAAVETCTVNITSNLPICYVSYVKTSDNGAFQSACNQYEEVSECTIEKIVCNTVAVISFVGLPVQYTISGGEILYKVASAGYSSIAFTVTENATLTIAGD